MRARRIPTTLLATLTLLAALSARAAPESAPPVCPSNEDAPDVGKLVAYTERAMSGKSMKGTMAMTIKTPAWTRKLKMALQSEGDDYALIRISEGGPREVGMMTLKREKQLWNYLPQAGRVMKLPSGMLGDSWMGSDFTNDDLVHGSSLTKDFDAKVEPSAPVDGKPVWRVVLVPKKDAVVVWGKIEMTIDRKSCIPLEQRFFDEDNKLARKMTFSDVKAVGWRQFPTKMVVSPADGDRETLIEYEDIAFDVDIPDDVFSLHRLQQGR